ncbi:uncharacterized protein LOC107832846 [Nicotiana tabacum]|uniref:Uncharacterized protein LOC107832846 n=2 Tax=Nicotiana TaxID=4085 RepID=A0A1S4DS43_TOBAC|nr:PREDICTED: uncharacterized protein LOC104218247 [Nicotiana sylvestris]XP_016516227.1 PREDICTED: uncharacterized protein LOC107832846 [Nicotiana tabacum]
MSIEDHTQSSSNSKKLKQKKVPQRGLGVAQLERIRLEEQHIKDETLHSPNVLSPNSIASAQDSSLRPKLNSSSIPTQTPLSSKNCDSRPNPSRTTGMIGEGEGEMNLGPGYDDCSKLWSSEYSPKEENQKLYQYGGAGGGVVQPNLYLSHEPQIPLLSLPNVLLRSQQYQQPACSSSMVNISSSVRNFQMEPPSNQSYNGCHYLPLWPEEVKMVGIKRPYPFPPEYPPVPAFQKYPPCYITPVSGSHESASFSNECTVHSESGTLHKREVPLRSRTLSEAKPTSVIGENRVLNGDFLTLAPPTAVGKGNQQDLSKFETTPFQEVAEEPSTRSGLNRLVQQPVFRFFPSANVQIGPAGITKSNCQGEVGGKVDLNLKL